MKRLDSIGYRYWYKLRYYIPWIKTKIPEPIIWKESKKLPNPSFIKDLDDNDKNKYFNIKKEIELISRIHNAFPNHIKDNQWEELLTFPTRKERLDYLKFIRRNEINREKEELKKLKKKESSNTVETNEGEYSFINIHPELRGQWKQMIESNKFYKSLLLNETPKIAVDCRFIPYLSRRAQNLTSIQLAYMMSENQKRNNKWPLYFVNFDSQQDVMKKCINKHLGGILNPKNLCGIKSENNYTEIFNKEDIIYLSPDSEEVLDKIESDKIYVIGAIVDRVPEKQIPKHASLEMSQVDQVKSKRLPLNEFVDWKSGTQYLTLVTVMKILQSNYDNNNNWKKTFDELIPTRYVKPAEEKNMFSREIHNNFRKYDNGVLKILEKHLGIEK